MIRYLSNYFVANPFQRQARLNRATAMPAVCASFLTRIMRHYKVQVVLKAASGLWCTIMVVVFGVSTSQAQQNPFDSLGLVSSYVVHFDFGLARVPDTAKHIIDSLVSGIDCETCYAYIHAHTDSIGSEENNIKLSRKRASVVRRLLLEHNMSSDRIRLDHFGERLPKSSNHSEMGRQLNRRTEISWYKPQPMMVIQGQIKDAETKEGIEAEIIFHHKSFRDSLKTDPDGSFKKRVVSGSVIGIDVIAKDHFFTSDFLKTSKKEILIELPPIKKGEVVALSHFYFVGNEAILLSRSKPQLVNLLTFMNQNSGVSIEVMGHINRPSSPPVPKTSSHFNLSYRRAKLVHDFLIGSGIDSSRVDFNGYGNWHMRFPKAVDPREQELNRRVEIKVLEVDRVVSEEEKK